MVVEQGQEGTVAAAAVFGPQEGGEEKDRWWAEAEVLGREEVRRTRNRRNDAAAEE
jgi:hypothetical protein